MGAVLGGLLQEERWKIIFHVNRWNLNSKCHLIDIKKIGTNVMSLNCYQNCVCKTLVMQIGENKLLNPV